MKHNLTINGTVYEYECIWAMQRKVPNGTTFGVQLSIEVYNTKTKKYVPWERMKGSYLSEKLVDIMKNTINGQRAVYWDWRKDMEVQDEQDKT